MKACLVSLLSVIGLAVGGCAGTTPIQDLTLPPVSAIEGTVTHLDARGFTLTDDSDSILVSATLPDNKNLGLSLKENVKVYGNLRGGQERVFDGYVIETSSGERIIVSNPTPHFGFIIQSSFQ